MIEILLYLVHYFTASAFDSFLKMGLEHSFPTYEHHLYLKTSLLKIFQCQVLMVAVLW